MNFIQFLQKLIHDSHYQVLYVDLKYLVKGYQENSDYVYSSKEALYKMFSRYVEKLEKEYGLTSKKIFLNNEEYAQQSEKFDGFVQRRKKDILIEADKGVYIGYQLEVEQEKINTIIEVFRLKNLKMNLEKKTRLTENPDLYLKNIDFELTHSKNSIQNWLDWFDDILISIDDKKIIEIEHQSDFGEIKHEKIIPIRLRENLYSYMYLIGIRVDDSNRVTEQIRYNDLAVVNLNNIKTIIKSNQFVANVSVFKDKAKYLRAYEYFIEKMNHQMDIILKSFVGVIPPEPVHHHYEKPFSLEIDINTFQVPFIRRYKVDFEELNSPKGEGYRRLRFKTNPSFEFIKQVLMLNDNWNYDISINDKRISNETSLEVVNNDSSVNAWIRDYLKQSHRRSLINYEDNPIIKRELEKEIKDWERNQDNPQTSVTYPFTCD